MEIYDKKPKKEKPKRKVEKIMCTLPEQGRQEILSDITGSYTGSPMMGSAPIQDADDL